MMKAPRCGDAVKEAEADYERRFQALLTPIQLEKRTGAIKKYGAGYVAWYPTR